MSLLTLLEAARYLEYKTEACARGEEPQDFATFTHLSSSADVANDGHGGDGGGSSSAKWRHAGVTAGGSAASGSGGQLQRRSRTQAVAAPAGSSPEDGRSPAAAGDARRAVKPHHYRLMNGAASETNSSTGVGGCPVDARDAISYAGSPTARGGGASGGGNHPRHTGVQRPSVRRAAAQSLTAGQQRLHPLARKVARITSYAGRLMASGGNNLPPPPPPSTAAAPPAPPVVLKLAGHHQASAGQLVVQAAPTGVTGAAAATAATGSTLAASGAVVTTAAIGSAVPPGHEVTLGGPQTVGGGGSGVHYHRPTQTQSKGLGTRFGVSPFSGGPAVSGIGGCGAPLLTAGGPVSSVVGGGNNSNGGGGGGGVGRASASFRPRAGDSATLFRARTDSLSSHDDCSRDLHNGSCGSSNSSSSLNNGSYNHKMNGTKMSSGGAANGPAKRRSGGAGTREVHNKLEKNRRAYLKECFEELKMQLTHVQDDRKTSNLITLRLAFEHIQQLKKEESELERQLEQLAREKISAQQRLAAIRKDGSCVLPVLDLPTMGVNVHQSAMGRTQLHHQPQRSGLEMNLVSVSPLEGLLANGPQTNANGGGRLGGPPTANCLSGETDRCVARAEDDDGGDADHKADAQSSLQPHHQQLLRKPQRQGRAMVTPAAASADSPASGDDQAVGHHVFDATGKVMKLQRRASSDSRDETTTTASECGNLSDSDGEEFELVDLMESPMPSLGRRAAPGGKVRVAGRKRANSGSAGPSSGGVSAGDRSRARKRKAVAFLPDTTGSGLSSDTPSTVTAATTTSLPPAAKVLKAGRGSPPTTVLLSIASINSAGHRAANGGSGSQRAAAARSLAGSVARDDASSSRSPASGASGLEACPQDADGVAAMGCVAVSAATAVDAPTTLHSAAAEIEGEPPDSHRPQRCLVNGVAVIGPSFAASASPVDGSSTTAYHRLSTGGAGTELLLHTPAATIEGALPPPPTAAAGASGGGSGDLSRTILAPLNPKAAVLPAYLPKTGKLATLLQAANGVSYLKAAPVAASSAGEMPAASAASAPPALVTSSASAVGVHTTRTVLATPMGQIPLIPCKAASVVRLAAGGHLVQPLTLKISGTTAGAGSGGGSVSVAATTPAAVVGTSASAVGGANGGCMNPAASAAGAQPAGATLFLTAAAGSAGGNSVNKAVVSSQSSPMNSPTAAQGGRAELTAMAATVITPTAAASPSPSACSSPKSNGAPNSQLVAPLRKVQLAGGRTATLSIKPVSQIPLIPGQRIITTSKSLKPLVVVSVPQTSAP